MNLRYKGIKNVEIEAYAYLLDFKNALAASTETYGVRASGVYLVNEKSKIIYVGEYAAQSDYADNPGSISEDYYLGELGVKLQLGGVLKSLVLKVDYEVLTGNGANSFLTPVATGHAFQGWADRFLLTPPDGIEDTYFTAVASAFGARFIAAYHMIKSDNLSYDYGNELDLLVTKTFKKNYTFGAKVAFYDADRNSDNIARGGARAADVTKTWFWVQIKF
ncbi:MAG: hypothetical protein GKR93_13255 [Gammaproteobacteria bacterium]|nr:hypothetical protein [Gammaproteobacteria bacterium]